MNLMKSLYDSRLFISIQRRFLRHFGEGNFSPFCFHIVLLCRTHAAALLSHVHSVQGALLFFQVTRSEKARRENERARREISSLQDKNRKLVSTNMGGRRVAQAIARRAIDREMRGSKQHPFTVTTANYPLSFIYCYTSTEMKYSSALSHITNFCLNKGVVSNTNLRGCVAAGGR